MPELPEVETVACKIRKQVCGRQIVAFEASWPRQVSPSIAKVRKTIVGRKIQALHRRGKYLVFQLDRGFLLVHLGMSGRIGWASRGEENASHLRAAWDLDNGERLLFYDARKFGRIRFVSDLKEIDSKLGLEPMDRKFTEAALAKRLRSRSGRLKPLLLSQRVVAGLGNIYTDEVLFLARLHPLQRTNLLSPDELRRLHRAIRQVLRKAISLCGSSIDWVYPGGRMQTRLKVYGRKGQACTRCGKPIQVIRVGQRSTHFCAACQPRKGK